MITRVFCRLQRIRRFFSRGEWSVRWLRLPREEKVADQNGLVIVQIDGLSRSQLEAAIAKGRMPFLRKLLERENYQLHSMYSGLPATTPAVQGELFYGEKCAVPAFGFREHESGRIVRMFARESAAKVQRDLASKGDGLLAGGSAYCNIYDGGAREANFCAASMGWDELVQQAKPWRLMLVAFFHAWSALRIAALMLIEFGLSVVDFFRGATLREFWQELIMVPARVVVVVLMRELAINGAIMDADRGLPIIYLNLLGYDEQAHRRGPSSAFAHWTLKGIDGAIRRLTKSARLSPARHYDVWILSDHGQEETTPYEFLAGQSLRESVVAVAHDVLGDGVSSEFNSVVTERAERSAYFPARVHWLSAGWLAAKLFGEDLMPEFAAQSSIQLAAVGPVGHIYLNRVTTDAQRIDLAKQLVRQHRVPFAAVPCSDRKTVLMRTKKGEFILPDECPPELAAHRFASEVVMDLCQLCHHPDAGDVILFGWESHEFGVSFVRQNGAHAGFGSAETHAFALLPSDAPVEVRAGNFIRPADVRNAALAFRQNRSPIQRPRPHSTNRDVRIMTYNVHACVGLDGKLSPKRIARVIADSEADIVALQELDSRRARTDYSDQADEIAKHLEMEYEFHPCWQLREGSYGNAILSRFPLRLVKSGALPQARVSREPRGAIWVEVTLPDGRLLQVINTHLSIYPTEQFQQAQALVGDGWVDAAQECGPTCLIGDFNARPKSKSYQLLASRLDDVDCIGSHRATWPSRYPITRIDHIFISQGDHEIRRITIPSSSPADLASDHLPLVATLAARVPFAPFQSRRAEV